MTTAATNMTIAPPDGGLAVGDRVGDLRVTEAGPRSLRLDAAQVPAVAAVCAAAIPLGIGLTRLVEVVNDPPKEWYAKDWWIPVVCLGLAVIWVFGRDLGRSYTFDGNTRTLTRRRWWFLARTWAGNGIRVVGVRVVHRGPYEVAILAIEHDGSVKRLTEAAADNRALKLPAVALRAAELLDAAVARDGVPVHGGVELRRALDRISAIAGSADIHDLRINCPACKRRDVAAVSYDYHEQHYGVRRTSTWVKCLECGTHLYSKATPDELAAMSLGQRDEVIAFRISLIKRMMALFSAVLCWFPWVGFVVSLVSTLINWRTPAWPRLVSRIALAVATVVTTAVTILISK
jgi:hypothetical protein